MDEEEEGGGEGEEKDEEEEQDQNEQTSGVSREVQSMDALSCFNEPARVTDQACKRNACTPKRVISFPIFATHTHTSLRPCWKTTTL